MATTYDLYLLARGDRADSAMAKILEVSPAAISQWKQTEHLSAYYAARCAEIAGTDIIEALALSAAESEKEDFKRRYLEVKLKDAHHLRQKKKSARNLTKKNQIDLFGSGEQ